MPYPVAEHPSKLVLYWAPTLRNRPYLRYLLYLKKDKMLMLPTTIIAIGTAQLNRKLQKAPGADIFENLNFPL